MRFLWYWCGVVVVACFFSNVSAQEAASCCQSPTVDEVRAVLRGASHHDAQVLLNLLYWSYKRSHNSLATQKAAEKNLREQWAAWQSCADRRLNPKAVSMHYQKHGNHELFEVLQKEFHDTQSQYSYIVEVATDAARYSSAAIAPFVASFREKSRRHVMHTIKHQLAVMAEELERQLREHALDLRSEHRGVISYLINTIAVASFAQLDASWRDHSNQLMGQFLNIQEVFNSVWTTIETTRAAFYTTYFELVCQVMRELDFPAASFTNLVPLAYELRAVPFALSLSNVL